ncbi:hypothetical protein Pst134EA_009418 [Puccinia striiformis f. sp. tritici]|uniref:Uncharacterized protein n=1 Tax=Puccinia striiformis TaxID=27350 RepID=A0A2S4V9R6_9BASI|nr:hypothetical protein Pst134EA_009418 [Puccinia striiformis f. sp. tritici]KAH9468889.1 hypothetical protein Pst134EA_009418 [Puccinia striiformis f. sp. tritici]POW06244.1 hypothetical protein PSHT_10437 [Puccinia striiformis]
MQLRSMPISYFLLSKALGPGYQVLARPSLQGNSHTILSLFDSAKNIHPNDNIADYSPKLLPLFESSKNIHPNNNNADDSPTLLPLLDPAKNIHPNHHTADNSPELPPLFQSSQKIRPNDNNADESPTLLPLFESSRNVRPNDDSAHNSPTLLPLFESSQNIPPSDNIADNDASTPARQAYRKRRYQKCLPLFEPDAIEDDDPEIFHPKDWQLSPSLPHESISGAEKRARRSDPGIQPDNWRGGTSQYELQATPNPHVDLSSPNAEGYPLYSEENSRQDNAQRTDLNNNQLSHHAAVGIQESHGEERSRRTVGESSPIDLDINLNNRRKELDLQGNSKKPFLFVSFPKESMNNEFLSSVCQNFKDHLKKIWRNEWRTYRRRLTQRKINEYPLAVFKVPQIEANKSSIWILNASTGLQQQIDELEEKFEDLIKWIIFINTAVLREIDKFKPSQDEFESHKKIVNWLFKEAFEPEHSLPVLGIIPQANFWKVDTGHGQFGPVQRILLDFLSSGEMGRHSLDSSISILKIAYKEFHSDIWKYSSTANSDIETVLNTMVIKAITSKMTVFQGTCDHVTDVKIIGQRTNRLGEFDIPDLNEIPKMLKPKYHQKNLAKAETDMILSFILKEFRKNMNGKIPIQGLPVTMIPHFWNKNLYRISILDHKGEVLNTNAIEKKLDSLLFHLKLCHKVLHDCEELHMMVKIPNLITSFNTWFRKILTNKEDGRLPIIGNVEKHAFGGRFEISQFNEVQIYLIKQYFADKDSQTKVIQVCLAILQYWYGTYYPRIFPTLKSHYWDAMIKSLSEKLEMDGTYSAFKFDSDANYIGRTKSDLRRKQRMN